MKIYYWSPCLNKVGTYKSTINSAISLAKYSKKKREIKIINSCGEWNEQKNFLNKNNIQVVNFGYDYFKYLPKLGFFGSRFSYLIIFILSFIPLLRILIKEKPDYLVIHLITSLPLIVNFFLRRKTKIILRISGFPKLNFVRKFLWKINRKIIYKITCPSFGLKKQLKDLNILPEDKIIFLADPIIDIKLFKKKLSKIKNEIDLFNKRKFFISVGRLTKQKNHSYLINEFKNFSMKNKEFELLIFGEGEDKKKLENLIKKNNLENNIKLMGYSDNVLQYMKYSQAFILSSLWEDPGFVLIEAAMCNLFIISSDCKNGPEEILNYGMGGMLYETNKKGELEKKLDEFLSLGEQKQKMRLSTKKNVLKYSLFRHFQTFDKILN